MSKGKHQPKPQPKKVSALLDSLRRRTECVETAKRHLIVCEDGVSAPSYFRELRRHLRLTATSVEVVAGDGGTQPIQVVQRGIDVSSDAQREGGSTEPFDHVWCVVDGDYGKKVAAARRLARASGASPAVTVVVTTPCFEYWLLLHHEESEQAAENCHAVVSALRQRHLHDYTKGGDFDFSGVVPKWGVATERAKRLRHRRRATDRLPEQHNPCSEIYVMVEAIMSSASPVARSNPNGR